VVFDGLDEVPPGHRRDCLRALDQYLTQLQHPVVVTCRRREYDELLTGPEKPLGLLAAVQTQPLPNHVIIDYLKRFASGSDVRDPDPRWEPVVADVLAGLRTEIVQALSTPLILSLVVETRLDPSQLPTTKNPDEISATICQAKVKTELAHHNAPNGTTPWLSAIAHTLKTSTTNQTTFTFENLTPPTAPPWLNRDCRIKGGSGLVLAG